MTILSYALAALLLCTAAAQELPDCSLDDVGFYPHPTDCTLYYACSGGVAYLEECPPGLWWSALLEVCDWPEDAYCAAASTPRPSTETSGEPSTEPPTEPSTELPTEPPTGLPDCSLDDVGFYPHPTDCTLYYACSGGVAYLEECPPGLWWSTLLEVCDWPEDAHCAAASTPRPSTETSEEPSTEPPTEPSTELPTEPPTGLPDCSLDDVGFYPHPTDCTLYYACSGGVAYLEECPPGLWWSALLEVCDWPEDAHCAATSTPRPSTEQSTESPTEPELTTNISYPTEPEHRV